MWCWTLEVAKFTLFKHEYLRWLNGDAPLLFIFSGVSKSGLSCTCRSNNTGFAHQGISESRFAMVHMGDHRHVPDVGLFVHDLPNLVYREVHLRDKDRFIRCWLWSKYDWVLCVGDNMWLSKQMNASGCGLKDGNLQRQCDSLSSCLWFSIESNIVLYVCVVCVCFIKLYTHCQLNYNVKEKEDITRIAILVTVIVHWTLYMLLNYIMLIYLSIWDIFWRGSPGKSRIPGSKYHIIGIASTRGHENHPWKQRTWQRCGCTMSAQFLGSRLCAAISSARRCPAIHSANDKLV